MGRIKAVGGAAVTVAIACWGFYFGVPEVLRYWGSAKTIDCREFLAGKQPSPSGAKVRLTDCVITPGEISGVSYGLGRDMDELFLPLGPRPNSSTWELALVTEDQDTINMIESNSTKLWKPHDFVGTLAGDEEDEFRTKFRESRGHSVVFLVEPTLIGAGIGIALSALGIFCSLATLGGLFIAITGREP